MIESLGVLPVYDNIDKQRRNWPCQANGNVCNVCLKGNKLLIPNFIFRRPASPYPVTAFNLYNSDGTFVITLQLSQVEAMQFTTGGQTWDYFFRHLAPLKTVAGLIYDDFIIGNTYYFEFVSAGGNYYSEQFCVEDNAPMSNDVELLNNPSFLLGVVGWTVQNTQVVITSSGGGNASMGDSLETGNMFKLSSTFVVPSPGTLYRICVEVTAFNSPSGMGSISVNTLDGNFIINSVGTHCFITRFPGDIQINSSASTWTIASISLQEHTGFECKSFIRYNNPCNTDKIPYQSVGNFATGNFTHGLIREFVRMAPTFSIAQNDFENGQKDKFKSFQRVDKILNFKDSNVSEAELDALHLMRTSANILIHVPETNEVLSKQLNVDETNITFVSEFIEQCIATVDMTVSNAFVIKSGCCDDFEEVDCPTCDDFDIVFATIEQPGVLKISPQGAGESCFPYYRLLYGIRADEEQDCGDITFTDTGIVLTGPQFYSSGFLYPQDNTVFSQCFKVVGYSPIIPDCSLESSSCICTNEG